jgi:PAS domain S-box-containing protein
MGEVILSEALRILILEDQPADAELVTHELRKAGFEFTAKNVTSEKEFLAELRNAAPELILADYSLLGYDGLSALAAAQKHCPETPFIFVSGTLGEEKAIETLRHGATDYVLKDRLARLEPAVRRALRDREEMRKREQAEKERHEAETRYRALFEQSRESEEQLRAMFDLASIGMAQAHPRTGQWLRVNQKMCAITGYSAAELLRMRVPEITHPDDRQKDREAFQRVVRGEAPDYRLEKRYVRKDGAVAWVNVNMTIIRDAAGQPTRTIATIEDITERMRAELRTTAFANLGQRLNAAKTAREASEIIVEVADQLLGWDACLFDLYSAAENRMSHLLSMDLINGRRTECKRPDLDPSPREFPKRAIEHGGQLILRDHPSAMRAEGLPFGDTSRPSASLMFVPIRNGAEVVGILSIQSYTPQAYDASSLETLQALADYGGGALERLRAQEALSESEANFRSVWER